MKNYIKIITKIGSFNKSIEVSGDKSISIRCVLLASQAIGKSKIYNLLESEDVINSLESINRLGIKFKKFKNYYEIYGFGIKGFNTKKKIIINAGNSGTLARLLAGLLVDSENQIKIIGDKSLSKRDFQELRSTKTFGPNISSEEGKLLVKINGSIIFGQSNIMRN